MTDRELLEENLKDMTATMKALEICIEETMRKLYPEKFNEEIFTKEEEAEIQKAFILQERARLKEKLQQIDKDELPF